MRNAIGFRGYGEVMKGTVMYIRNHSGARPAPDTPESDAQPRRKNRDTVIISRKEQDSYLRQYVTDCDRQPEGCRGDLDPELENMLLAL